MAHREQFQFIQKVKNLYPTYFSTSKVLEVGSLNINGSVRQFFTECDYIGIDVGPGLDVDLVVQGQDYDGPDDYFDVVISCECFEHNPYWVETFRNMHRVCKPNGLIIMTCATTGRAEHGTARTSPQDSPLTTLAGWDYYKNLTEQDFLDNFNLSEMFSSFEFDINSQFHDLYFVGTLPQQ